MRGRDANAGLATPCAARDVGCPSPPPSPSGDRPTKLHFIIGGQASPWRRLDEDDADGRAAVDHERMAISTARERQPAYERAADPQRANGRVQCQRDECVERRRLARAQADELRDLKANFDFKLEGERRWLIHNAGREAWRAAERQDVAARKAKNFASSAKGEKCKAEKARGEQEARAERAESEAEARARELAEISARLDDTEARLAAVDLTVAGYAHQEKKLSKLRAKVIAERKASKAQYAADVAAAEERYAARLEEERASVEYLEAELAGATEGSATLQAQLKEQAPPQATAEQWAKYSEGGARWQRARHVNYLCGLFGASKWRGADVASALKKSDLLYEVWESAEFQDLLFDELSETIESIEQDHFNPKLALHLKLFCHLSRDQLITANNFACMNYDREKDSYDRRPLRRFRGGRVLYVPRFIPPRCRWEPLMLEYKAKIHLSVDDDGKLAWVPFDDVMDRMFRFDRDSLPDLNIFSKANPFTIVAQLDGTGFGSLSIAQLIFRSVYTSQSPRHCHLATLLRGDDHHAGAGQLTKHLADPMAVARANGCLPHPFLPGRSLPTRFIGSGDKMGILHINGRSQMCTCRGTDQRLALPPRRKLLGGFDAKAAPQLRALCVRPTHKQMVSDAHEIVPGESVPRPCRWPGCKFGHDPATAQAEYDASRARLARLEASHLKEDIKELAKLRSTHLATHGNQHLHKAPRLDFDMAEWIIDLLHYMYLNIPKGTFKYTWRYKSPDEVLPRLSAFLKYIKLPLDMRTKEQNVQKKEAWYTGGAFQRFADGDSNSLGLARNISVMLRIWAEHVQEAADVRAREQEARRAKKKAAAAPTSAAALGIGRAARVAAAGCEDCETDDSDDDEPEAAEGRAYLKELRSDFETRCDQGAIAYIKSKYSSSVASRVLRIALSWEASRLHYKSIVDVRECDDTEAGKDAAALNVALTAVDNAAMTYLVSHHNIKSWYYHNGVFKLPFDVRDLGSAIWGANCSSMEAHGAAVLKRIAGTTVQKGAVNTSAKASGAPPTPAAGEKRGGATAPPTPVTAKKPRTLNSSFAQQIAEQALMQQELRIDKEMGIDSRDNARLLLKEHGGRTTKARSTPKLRCVESALEMSVLTEFAALLRGEWGAELPSF